MRETLGELKLLQREGKTRHIGLSEVSVEENGLGFIPWFPLGSGRLDVPPEEALAWLLKRSPVMLPIPGTSSVAHLEQNMRALSLLD